MADNYSENLIVPEGWYALEGVLEITPTGIKLSPNSVALQRVAAGVYGMESPEIAISAKFTAWRNVMVEVVVEYWNEKVDQFLLLDFESELSEVLEISTDKISRIDLLMHNESTLSVDAMQVSLAIRIEEESSQYEDMRDKAILYGLDADKPRLR